MDTKFESPQGQEQQRPTTQQRPKRDFKENPYKCLVILIYSCLALDHQRHNLEKAGRHFDSREQLLDELKAEWHNMLLLAPDDTVKAVHWFIQEPTPAAFKSAAVAMGKDLWGWNFSPEIAGLDFDTVQPE